MSNSEGNANAPKTRTSVLKKHIKRTIKTAEYESLVIEDGFEEVIEWDTLEERQRKADNWDKILVERFKISHDRILEELGYSNKKAFFKNPNQDTINKFKDVKSRDESASRPKNPNLDMMDIA